MMGDDINKLNHTCTRQKKLSRILGEPSHAVQRTVDYNSVIEGS